jgi:predicted AlkP superfamily pyrophosphatase or phosphodiesterase
MTNKVIFFLAALLLLQTSCKQSRTTNDARYLIVLSMDGFRKDYTEKSNTPNLDSIALIGVRAEGILPAFPSKTFPNHYTMATGLYPDHHGIVNNSNMDNKIILFLCISYKKATLCRYKRSSIADLPP